MTAPKYRNAGWAEFELNFIREHKDLTPAQLSDHLELLGYHRTLNACAQARFRLDGRKPAKPDECLVREPGEYAETLADLLVDDWGCLEIWLRWNGYSHAREASRSLNGWVTLICTAKG